MRSHGFIGAGVVLRAERLEWRNIHRRDAEIAEIAEKTQSRTSIAVVRLYLCVFSAISAFSAVSEPLRPYFARPAPHSELPLIALRPELPPLVCLHAR